MLDLRSARSAALSPPVIPAKPCARLLQAKPDRDVPSCAAADTSSRYTRRESALRAAILRVTTVSTGFRSLMVGLRFITVRGGALTRNQQLRPTTGRHTIISTS